MTPTVMPEFDLSVEDEDAQHLNVR